MTRTHANMSGIRGDRSARAAQVRATRSARRATRGDDEEQDDVFFRTAGPTRSISAGLATLALEPPELVGDRMAMPNVELGYRPKSSRGGARRHRKPAHPNAVDQFNPAGSSFRQVT